jgi:predicted transposase/invertase (TIGR01784 family)
MLLTEWKEEDALKIRWEEGWEEGWGEGREEGVEEGMEKKAIKIAEKMKDEGMDVSTIARLTGLAIDDILRL